MDSEDMKIIKQESCNNNIEDINEEINNNELNKEIEEDFKCINDDIKLNYNEECLFKLEYNKESTEEEIKNNENKENNHTNSEDNKNENENIQKDKKENSLIFSPILGLKQIKDNLQKIPGDSKYGLDINGNPIEINESNKDKIIAYIVQKNNEENYLIDIQGNVLSKTDEDYYYYKNGEEIIIITDFDVKHPELRIYGHRKINFNEIKKNFDENITKASTKNTNKSVLLIEDKENINKNPNTDINNIEEIISLNNNINKNRSVIIEQKKSNNDKYKKINMSPIIDIRNNEFKYQMDLWRKRYGKNNDFIENKNIEKEKVINKIPKRKYSYSNNNKRANECLRKEKNDLINRTDSILKMTSNLSKNDKYDPTSKYKKLTSSKENKSLSNNRNYSYINIKDNNYERKIREKLEHKKYERNKTLEYINNKYNNISTDLYNEEDRVKRANLLKNIKEKYNKKIYNNKTLIEKEENKEKIKKSKIDSYIYSNLKKINFMKKNSTMKCSVLKTEVNQIISNFNKNQINSKNKEIISINYENEKYSYDEIPYNTKGERLFFEYGNDENVLMYKKIRLIPSKIRKNKLEIYNTNFQKSNSIIKLDNNIYYRKIKNNKY